MDKDELIAFAKQAWYDHAPPWMWQWAHYYCAQIEAESSWENGQVSRDGARGLCQMLPITAERYGLTPEQLEDPEKALIAGAKHMAHCINFAYNPVRRLRPATPFDALQLGWLAYISGEAYIHQLSNGDGTHEYVAGILIEQGQPLTAEMAISVLPRVTGRSSEAIAYHGRIMANAANYL